MPAAPAAFLVTSAAWLAVARKSSLPWKHRRRAAPGEIVGIVGASGSSKTTLVDLVAGLLVPQSGEVRCGGTVLNRNNATQWRQRISYAGQDAQLINDTIRRNLCTRASEIADQEIWDALDRAGVAASVRPMPEGLDTVVGERGIRLSSGLGAAGPRRGNECDRYGHGVAAARGTIGTRPPPPPIILIVAHRSTSLSRCTRIVTMDEGRIGEVRVAG